MREQPAGTPPYGGQGAAWQAYLVPKSRRFLPNDADTYGKLFNRTGYATAFMGKWHLGTAPHYPEQRGFDVVVRLTDHRSYGLTFRSYYMSRS